LTIYRAEVVIFAIAFAVFGLVTLALVWSGGWAYELLARATGHTETTFLVRTGGGIGSGAAVIDLQGLLDWHGKWASYVTGISASAPSNTEFFTNDELAHMADVHAVFHSAEIGAVLAFFVATFRVARARSQGYALRLVRAGSLIAAGIVTVIGIAAAVAFEPLFLLFHDVFFPQGNFLFDPATSNLIRLYPEWYWQGITAGVGLSFIVAALLVAAAAHMALRRRSNTYTRAA
jgi:integral membrane protein (TIGR01906 family)